MGHSAMGVIGLVICLTVFLELRRRCLRGRSGAYSGWSGMAMTGGRGSSRGVAGASCRTGRLAYSSSRSQRRSKSLMNELGTLLLEEGVEHPLRASFALRSGLKELREGQEGYAQVRLFVEEEACIVHDAPKMLEPVLETEDVVEFEAEGEVPGQPMEMGDEDFGEDMIVYCMW